MDLVRVPRPGDIRITPDDGPGVFGNYEEIVEAASTGGATLYQLNAIAQSLVDDNPTQRLASPMLPHTPGSLATFMDIRNAPYYIEEARFKKLAKGKNYPIAKILAMEMRRVELGRMIRFERAF